MLCYNYTGNFNHKLNSNNEIKMIISFVHAYTTTDHTQRVFQRNKWCPKSKMGFELFMTICFLNVKVTVVSKNTNTSIYNVHPIFVREN